MRDAVYQLEKVQRVLPCHHLAAIGRGGRGSGAPGAQLKRDAFLLLQMGENAEQVF